MCVKILVHLPKNAFVVSHASFSPLPPPPLAFRKLKVVAFVHQTSVLVQKNSEATQALAAQEDILEKELGEIQKVLLSMQVQIFNL